MKPIRNVLVATDFSPASRPAFRRAVDMAAANGAALWITHVSVPTPAALDGQVLPRVYEEMEAAVRSDAQKRLRKLLDVARKSGVRARSLLLRGAPHEAIVRAARGRRADIVVLGTHGRTGLARFLIGSVASRVVALSPCPVLTVKGR
jgi:nucleotide-binding universal stress UspA family protein